MPPTVDWRTKTGNRAMEIWQYQDRSADESSTRAGVQLANCIYCHTRLLTPSQVQHVRRGGDDFPGATNEGYSNVVKCCPMCGWWSVCKETFLQLRGRAEAYVVGCRRAAARPVRRFP